MNVIEHKSHKFHSIQPLEGNIKWKSWEASHVMCGCLLWRQFITLFTLFRNHLIAFTDKSAYDKINGDVILLKFIL